MEADQHHHPGRHRSGQPARRGARRRSPPPAASRPSPGRPVAIVSKVMCRVPPRRPGGGGVSELPSRAAASASAGCQCQLPETICRCQLPRASRQCQLASCQLPAPNRAVQPPVLQGLELGNWKLEPPEPRNCETENVSIANARQARRRGSPCRTRAIISARLISSRNSMRVRASRGTRRASRWSPPRSSASRRRASTCTGAWLPSRPRPRADGSSRGWSRAIWFVSRS